MALPAIMRQSEGLLSREVMQDEFHILQTKTLLKVPRGET